MGQTLTTIPSTSNPNKAYSIIRGDDGVVYCDCMAWKMSKDCKHLRGFLHQLVNKYPKKETEEAIAQINKIHDRSLPLDAVTNPTILKTIIKKDEGLDSFEIIFDLPCTDQIHAAIVKEGLCINEPSKS